MAATRLIALRTENVELKTENQALRLRAAVLEGCLWRNMDPSDATKEDAAIWAALPQVIANVHPASGPKEECQHRIGIFLPDGSTACADCKKPYENAGPKEEPEQPPCSNCGAEVKTLRGFVAHSCPGHKEPKP